MEKTAETQRKTAIGIFKRDSRQLHTSTPYLKIARTGPMARTQPGKILLRLGISKRVGFDVGKERAEVLLDD
jgi:hypothetical protein